MLYKDAVAIQLGESIAATETDVATTDVDEYMKEGLQTMVNSIPTDMLFQLETTSDFAVASTPSVSAPYVDTVGDGSVNANAGAYTDSGVTAADAHHYWDLPANVTVTAVTFTLTWAYGGSGSGTWTASHRAGITSDSIKFANASNYKQLSKTYTQGTTTDTITLTFGTPVTTSDASTKLLLTTAITNNGSLGDVTITTAPTISAITYTSQASEGVNVGTNKVLYVMREHDTETITDGTKLMVECREVPPSLKGRLSAGSGWQEQATESDPVYYKQGNKVHILPTSLSAKSLVYWVSVPPTTWADPLPSANTYMSGSILKELEPMLLSYTVMRCLQQKLAKVQIGASASIEQDIADEDFDIVQARQVLVQDLTQRIQEKEKDFQTGLALLQRGTYQDKTSDDVKRPPTYAGIAQ